MRVHVKNIERVRILKVYSPHEHTLRLIVLQINLVHLSPPSFAYHTTSLSLDRNLNE